MKEIYVDLKSFVGRTIIFNGYSEDVVKGGGWSYASEDARVCTFMLDGDTYLAMENPDDGYRSSLSYVKKSDPLNKTIQYVCKNKIPSHFVYSVTSNDGDVVDFVDKITNKIVLSIGTNFADDYYPCCVMSFCPENLAINKNKALYLKIMREYKLKRILNEN